MERRTNVNTTTKKNSSRNEFTRICIAEAVIALLKEKNLQEIRISNVVLKAGVSRMTFYNNYHSVEEVLKDYLHILIGKYMQECEKHTDIGQLRDCQHVLFSLNFFDQYRTYFTVMKENGLHYIILDAMNQFMQSIQITYEQTYEMYFYTGGLLNIFLEWESEKERKSADEIAEIINNYLKKA